MLHFEDGGRLALHHGNAGRLAAPLHGQAAGEYCQRLAGRSGRFQVNLVDRLARLQFALLVGFRCTVVERNHRQAGERKGVLRLLISVPTKWRLIT